MASLKFKANFTKNTKWPVIRQALEGVLAGPIYAGIPTAFNLNGPAAMAVGGGSSILTGILFDMPGLIAGTLGAMSLHAMYIWGQKPVYNLTKRYIWRYNQDALPNPDPTQLYGLRNGPAAMNRSLVKLRNGDQVWAHRATDLPATAAPAATPALPPATTPATAAKGVSDYYRRQGVSDYYRGSVPGRKQEADPTMQF